MVLSDTSKGDIGWRKWVVAGWAFMECLFFGGLLYGWPSLVWLLKDEGMYADLCDGPDGGAAGNVTNSSVVYSGTSSGNGSVVVVAMPTALPSGNVTASTMMMATEGTQDLPCKAQDSMMALCFTIGSALFCISSAVLGHINYKFGTRVTRIISFLFFVGGCLCLAFVTVDVPWLIYPGLSMVGIGGLPILVTNMQVSNLFSKGSSSLVGLLCGGFDMSSAVMLVSKIAYEGGFARRYMFILLAVLHLLLLVSTFGFLPRYFIPRMDDTKERKEIPDGETNLKLLQHGSEKGDGDVVPAQPVLPSLGVCVRNPMFITHCVWLSLLQLKFYYFLGTLNPYLYRTLDGDKQLVSYFTDVGQYTMMGGLLSSFFSGFVYDWQKRRCAGGRSRMYREAMPAVLPLSVGSLCGILMSVMVLIPVQALLYPIFISMTLYRSFMYSLAAAFLSTIFPTEYFGLLYGIMIVSAGLLSLLQYAFFLWAEAYASGPLHADIFMLCLLLASFVHPVYIWLCSWKEERKFHIN